MGPARRAHVPRGVRPGARGDAGRDAARPPRHRQHVRRDPWRTVVDAHGRVRAAVSERLAAGRRARRAHDPAGVVHALERRHRPRHRGALAARPRPHDRLAAVFELMTPGSAAEPAAPSAARWRALVWLALTSLLGMSTWFSGTAVIGPLREAWALTPA